MGPINWKNDISDGLLMSFQKVAKETAKEKWILSLLNIVSIRTLVPTVEQQ